MSHSLINTVLLCYCVITVEPVVIALWVIKNILPVVSIGIHTYSFIKKLTNTT